MLYGLVKREPLIRAMITGAKPAHRYEDAAEAEIVARPLARALAALIAAAALVLGTILAVGGRLWVTADGSRSRHLMPPQKR